MFNISNFAVNTHSHFAKNFIFNKNKRISKSAIKQDWKPIKNKFCSGLKLLSMQDFGLKNN